MRVRAPLPVKVRELPAPKSEITPLTVSAAPLAMFQVWLEARPTLVESVITGEPERGVATVMPVPAGLPLAPAASRVSMFVPPTVTLVAAPLKFRLLMSKSAPSTLLKFPAVGFVVIKDTFVW